MNWQGNITRSNLIEAFAFYVQQAYKDLINHIECRKTKLTYDMRLPTYLRGNNFKTRYFQRDAAEYFAQLQEVEKGLVAKEQSWNNFFPGYAATPIPARGVDPDVLREVLKTIRGKSALKITYQSMSRPEPTARWIEPHALAFDGLRWHARAFCRNDGVFKDFLLSRIVEVGDQADATSSAEIDADWHSEISLEIGPHPELSDTQRRAIEMDYGMIGIQAEIVVRKALLFYALKRLGLDTDPAARRPQDQQIVLMNAPEIGHSMASVSASVRGGVN